MYGYLGVDVGGKMTWSSAWEVLGVGVMAFVVLGLCLPDENELTCLWTSICVLRSGKLCILHIVTWSCCLSCT